MTPPSAHLGKKIYHKDSRFIYDYLMGGVSLHMRSKFVRVSYNDAIVGRKLMASILWTYVLTEAITITEYHKRANRV